MPERRVGWQPSRFLTDRAEAERAFALAEQLGSVNAAAAELGTTWPSLRKAFGRHGLGMPARNPEAVRQRAIAAARQRTGRPATPTLDPVFVALNPGALPARERSPAELYEWVRRDEEYAILGANVVVELYSESHARQPTTRAWAIIRRAERAHRRPPATSAAPSAARPTVAAAADRTSRSQPTPGAGDGCRCPLITPAPKNQPTSADTSQLILIRVLRLGLFLQDRPATSRMMYHKGPLRTARFRWRVDHRWTRRARSRAAALHVTDLVRSTPPTAPDKRASPGNRLAREPRRGLGQG